MIRYDHKQERKCITRASMARCTMAMSLLVTRRGSRMQSAVSVVSIYLSLGSFASDFASNDPSPLIHCLFVANLKHMLSFLLQKLEKRIQDNGSKGFSLKMTVWIIQVVEAISQESSQAIPVWQLFNIEMKVKMINLLHNFHLS